MQRKLDEALATIANRPRIGVARPKWGTGYRAYLVHPYVVLYRVRDDSLDIARIVHVKRDSASWRLR